jgi:hypothetical protein
MLWFGDNPRRGAIMKSRPRFSAVVLVALAITLGCNITSGSLPTADSTSDSPSTSTETPGSIPDAVDSPSQPTDLAWIYDTPYDPINLTATPDDSHQATAVIPVEGGTLTATGADGTTYTLDIPGDALLAETEISLTPMQSLEGLPFGEGTASAVQMSPDGLSFNNFVTLTITPAQPIPLDEQILFDFEADGQALGLALPVLDPNIIQIQLLHFSGAGVTKGLLADTEPERRRLGGSEEARLHTAMSAVFQEARQNDETVEWVVDKLQGYILEFIDKVVKPRIEAADKSCANARLALKTIVGIEHYTVLLGMGEYFSSEMARLSDIAGEVCLKEEYELCVEKHIVHRIVYVWHSMLRQVELNGGDVSVIEQKGKEYIEKCQRFDLEFESTAVTEKDGGSFESIVKAKIPLRAKVEGLKVTIEGESALVNESYEVKLPGCKTNPSRGGATFTVLGLDFVIPDSMATGLGTVFDLKLKYDPGTTTESVAVDCQGLKMTFPGVLWTEAFHATHKSDFGSATIWKILGGELYARNEWDLRTTLQGGTVTEIGSFKLTHTPGQ